MELHALPEDGWLDTSPALQYFCNCDHTSSAHCEHSTDDDLAAARRRWTPSKEKICIADSYVLVSRDVSDFAPSFFLKVMFLNQDLLLGHLNFSVTIVMCLLSMTVGNLCVR